MKKKLQTFLIAASVMLLSQNESKAQITLLQDYANNTSAAIGTFQNINYREGGFSALYPIAGTNGKEFWTCSDRGVNVDAANANPVACHPTYERPPRRSRGRGARYWQDSGHGQRPGLRSYQRAGQ